MTFAKVDVSPQRFVEAEKLLTALPFELRTGVVEKALRAAAAPVVKWAISLAPDSIKTGTRELWSKSVKLKRAATKQLAETIGTSSIRAYGEKMAIYAGPIHPSGNLINAVGHSHAQVLWGRRSGSTIKPVTFMQQAGEITKSEQGAAFTKKFETESTRILRKLAKESA